MIGLPITASRREMKRLLVSLCILTFVTSIWASCVPKGGFPSPVAIDALEDLARQFHP
jgi:hypothetical protein